MSGIGEMLSEEMKGALKHICYQDLLHVMQQKIHVFLVGPAGSGKTTAVEEAAKEMGLPFHCVSVGPQTTQTNLMGYMDATGTYRSTAFRRAYEDGGVFLLDEFDAGNPAVMTVLNAALATDVCSFPDGMIPRHENFICVAAGNTYGTGANRKYIGRNQLDAASLDRYYVMDFPYDEDFERSLANHDKWVNVVQTMRKTVENFGVSAVISPRASISGAKLLRSGFDVWKTIQGTIFKGLSEDTITKVKADKSVARAIAILLKESAGDGRMRKTDVLELLADNISDDTEDFHVDTLFGQVHYTRSSRELTFDLKKIGGGTLRMGATNYISDKRHTLKHPEFVGHIDDFMAEMSRVLGGGFSDLGMATAEFAKVLSGAESVIEKSHVDVLRVVLDDLQMYLEAIQ